MIETVKKENFFKKNLPLILAFAIPVITLFVTFATRQIFPFGEEMYLRSDEYHQYAPFLKEFQRILQNGKSLEYTWNIGLGSDMPSLYAYYLASPLNWIIALFSDKFIPEIMECFIIIKAGLMSAAFAYYVQKHFRRRDYISTAFGIFYGMSSYMAAYSWNLMWLDCLVLLPLIVLGLERLVKHGKVVLYTITLAVAALSNYYITIMIAIFLVIYFLYLAVCEGGKKKGFKNFLKKAGNFALYSVLAALMACAAIIPAYTMLSATASGNFSFPTKLTAYFNFLEMVSHGIMLVEPTVLKGYVPNIYCTVGLFMLVPLYWLCGKINYKEKIGKSLVLVVFLLSFGLNIPTYIWHGFHFPNSLSSRQSFIYIFLVLVIGYEIMAKIRYMNYKQIVVCFLAGTMAIFALQALYASEDYTFIISLVSAGFLALYAVWAVLVRAGRAKKTFLIISLLVVVVAEAAINTGFTGYYTSNRTYYTSDNEDIEILVNTVEGREPFKRIEKIERRTKNDGTWSDYMSASEFSSTVQAKIEKFYDQMGMQASTNAFSYYGHTPLTAALLGIKYEIADADLQIDDQLKSFEAQSGDLKLYSNKYALSLGYMVNGDIGDVYNPSSNPFKTQNSFTYAACGIDDLYTVSNSQQGETVIFTAKDDGRQFVYISEKLKKAKAVITRGNEEIFSKSFTSLENPQILDLGDVKKGDKISIESEDEDVSRITVYPALMDYEVYEEIMEELGEGQLQITDFKDSDIKGTVHADEDGTLFTTIVYHDGWEAYVDGERVPAGSFNGAFVTVNIAAGDHEIAFIYHSKNFYLGIAISVTADLVFVCLVLLKYRRKKKRFACNLSDITVA